ncbi:MAG: agmatinase [Firmicutes bacterium]|nr:agmatinase [Bacillota bacterium]
MRALDLLVEKPQVFMGGTAGLDEAGAALLGVPLDLTASFRPGTRFGPAKVREVSHALEEYSPELHRELDEAAFHDCGDVRLGPEGVSMSLGRIREAVQELLALGKLPVLMGGEHLLTLAAVGPLRSRYPDLAVIQMDAHADLRNDYLGQTLSHATVMRRVVEQIGPENLFQLGIRSGTREEFIFAGERTRLHRNRVFEPMVHEVLPRLAGKPVYVTLDIDVVDPAYAPATGTPEPGGVSSAEVLETVRALKEARVVGFDVVEFCPPADHSDITAVLVAKIVRECILALGRA